MEVNIYTFFIFLSFIVCTFCDIKSVVIEPVTNYYRADKRFKRVIEYTRWRMATRTTPDFFMKPDDDPVNAKISNHITIDKPHDIENVIIAGPLPKSSTTALISDGTTKDYTRFVLPKQTETPEEIYIDLGFVSSTQASELIVKDTMTEASTTSKEPEESSKDSPEDLQEIYGINQNAFSDESQTVDIPSVHIVPFEVSHQVAPLAQFTNSHQPTESPLKPDPIERKPFSPAHPILKKPVRTSPTTDIFVPTRMYFTPITEDFGDFFIMKPDEKYVSVSSPVPIEALHKTVQVVFPEVSRSTFYENPKTDVQIKSNEKTTKRYMKVNSNPSDIEIEVERGNPSRTKSLEENSFKDDFKINDHTSKSQITTDSDYIEVRRFNADRKEFSINTAVYTYSNPTHPTNTPLVKEVEKKEKEMITSSESDYSLAKENIYYHKEKDEKEKNDKKVLPSRLDQFYDHIYVKYEEPREPIPPARKSIVSDRSDYDEEENIEVIPLSSAAPATMAAEMGNKIDKPAVTIVPFLNIQPGIHEPSMEKSEESDESDEGDESEESDKSIYKTEKMHSVSTARYNVTDLFPFTTNNFRAVTDQAIQSQDLTTYGNMCSLVKLTPLNFKSARSLYEINLQLQMWSQNPMVRIIDITKGNLTYMDNPINLVVVDNMVSRKDTRKVTVMVVAGISGRDHFAVSSAIYLLYQLIDKHEAHKTLLSKYRFWVIPVLNPDGYHYSTTFPKQRNWMKNLHQYYEDCKTNECESCLTRGTNCKLKMCYGVNIDRNFAYQWIPSEEKAADHICGLFYVGNRPISEPETKALSNFLQEPPKKLHAFITLKEGDILGIMYPYSHTKDKRPFANVYKSHAFRAASAAYTISGRPYVAGQISEFLPLFSGGLEDWVDHYIGIDNIYTIMLSRQSDANNPAISIEQIVHEGFAAVDSLLLRNPDSAPAPVQLKHNVESRAKSYKAIAQNIILLAVFTVGR